MRLRPESHRIGVAARGSVDAETAAAADRGGQVAGGADGVDARSRNGIEQTLVHEFLHPVSFSKQPSTITRRTTSRLRRTGRWPNPVYHNHQPCQAPQLDSL